MSLERNCLNCKRLSPALDLISFSLASVGVGIIWAIGLFEAVN